MHYAGYEEKLNKKNKETKIITKIVPHKAQRTLKKKKKKVSIPPKSL